MDNSSATTKTRLPDFTLTPDDYGWVGRFPGERSDLLGTEILIRIDNRLYPNDPKVLPPVTKNQAALVKKISSELPAIVRKVEQELLAYTKTTDTNIQSVIQNPHVWLHSEYDDGETWAFVIGRNDNPDFGYHVEFKGTAFVEIWAGD